MRISDHAGIARSEPGPRTPPLMGPARAPAAELEPLEAGLALVPSTRDFQRQCCPKYPPQAGFARPRRGSGSQVLAGSWGQYEPTLFRALTLESSRAAKRLD